MINTSQGTFSNFLTPIEQFRFTKHPNNTSSSWSNISHDFTIYRTLTGWQWKKHIDLYSQADKLKYVVNLKNDESFKTLSQAKQDVLQTFKKYAPDYYAQVSQKMIRSHISIQLITNEEKPNKVIEDLYVEGKTQYWFFSPKLLAHLTDNISEDNPVIDDLKEPAYTKKESLMKLHNILSFELYTFYDKNQYEYSLNCNSDSTELWWTLFISPTINLTEIF